MKAGSTVPLKFVEEASTVTLSAVSGPEVLPIGIQFTVTEVVITPQPGIQCPSAPIMMSFGQAAVVQSGCVASISGTTIWRWLNEDAIRPWQHRCWIFPRDPHFAQKAGRILDLYERIWNGHSLKDDEFVLSTDEKTSIQARRRRHSSLPTQPGAPMKVEHEYKRCGAWAYLAALDVHRARLFGRCERKSGIQPFDRLVDQVMRRAPYNEARRVFWVMDNGSSHRAPACIPRLCRKYPRLVPVHGPVHASWLNQIEIYFPIVQRKALTPNDFDSLKALRRRLIGFQKHYERVAKPFEWKFRRADLHTLLNKIQAAHGQNTLAYL